MGVHVIFVYYLGSCFVRLSLIIDVGVSCTPLYVSVMPFALFRNERSTCFLFKKKEKKKKTFANCHIQSNFLRLPYSLLAICIYMYVKVITKYLRILRFLLLLSKVRYADVSKTSQQCYCWLA